MFRRSPVGKPANWWSATRWRWLCLESYAKRTSLPGGTLQSQKRSLNLGCDFHWTNSSGISSVSMSWQCSKWRPMDGLTWSGSTCCSWSGRWPPYFLGFLLVLHPKKPTRAIRGSITLPSERLRDSKPLPRLWRVLVTGRMISFSLLRLVFRATLALQVSTSRRLFLE